MGIGDMTHVPGCEVIDFMYRGDRDMECIGCGYGGQSTRCDELARQFQYSHIHGERGRFGEECETRLGAGRLAARTFVFDCFGSNEAGFVAFFFPPSTGEQLSRCGAQVGADRTGEVAQYSVTGHDLCPRSGPFFSH